MAASWLCLLVFGLTQSMESDQTSSDLLRERLFREGPLGWERLKKSERQLVGKMHYERWTQLVGKPEKTPARERIVWFQRNNDLWATRMGYRGVEANAKYPESVKAVVAGSQNDFYMTQTSKTAPYQLHALSPKGSFEASSIANNSMFLPVILRSPTNLWTLDLPMNKVIKDPGFVIRKLSEIQDQDGLLMKIDFELHSQPLKLNLTDAWVTLRPSQDWAIIQIGMTTHPNLRVLVTNSYRNGSDGHPALYRHQERTTSSKEQIEDYSQWTFEELEHRIVPESEFTMTAFGLPEPDRPLQTSGNKPHYWFFGAAALLGLFALGLRWIAWRRTLRPSGSIP